MSSTDPTREDIDRLVTAVIRSDESAARLDEAGVAEERVVDRIWNERSEIWETASSQVIALQTLQRKYDRSMDVRVTEVVRQERLRFRDAQIILFTTLPLIISLYFVARYSEV